MVAAVRRAVEAGELRADLDVELMDDLFVGPMLVRTIHRPDASLPEDLADRIIRTLVEGLAPRWAPDTTPVPARAAAPTTLPSGKSAGQA